MTTSTTAQKSQLVTDERLNSINARIPFESLMQGDLFTEGKSEFGIKIDGTIEGSVIIKNGGVIHIGESGVVKGASLEADYIFIEGNVDSNIVARKGVEFTGTANIKGKVDYNGSLNMHNLAKVRASINFIGAD